ncbi:neuropeptide F receptor-like protein [Dinothrombium tinctorium]|uniref:Neuropeptide F receptor-like protein n=1 Tax=Dinothrombium tinctorium TaxID=1965070 RepID=A0A3S3RS33_9ACAR|nr:neuropeptide F receptor-like protein [Dinothrombium tinctorium]RWS03916.1 neuropeptide F receptor-like protein [Dinothrombium tinctorium]RWS13864.1 neuropeptide F receptor-like protein [Dinothrombium tinctorium]
MFNISERKFVLSLYFLFGLSGVLSNIFLMLIIISVKKLRTTVNMLIINLSISDILICIVCVPFTATHILHNRWFFYLYACKFVALIQAISVFVSALTISAIAFHRWKVITGNYRVNVRTNSYKKTFAMVWLLAILISLPICICFSDVRIEQSEFYLYNRCLETWSIKARSFYSSVTFVVQLILPLLSLIACQLKIHFHLAMNNLHSQQTKCEITSNGEIFVVSRCYRECRERNKRVVLTLFCIWIAFLVSWLPWHLINLYFDCITEISFSAQKLNLLFASCHLIAISSATTNPILYGWFNASIRNEVKTLKVKIFQYFQTRNK